MSITLAIPGDPLPKQRPRFSKRRAYTPQRTRQYELAVKWTAKADIRKPLTGSLALEVTFFRKTRRRVDVDNLLKAVMDGLQGVAYIDDSQIMEVTARRRVDPENPRTEIELKSL